MFKVGEKVVCLIGTMPSEAASGRAMFGTTEWFPVRGQTYTVRDVFEHDVDPIHQPGKRMTCIRLKEIRNKKKKYVQGYMEFCFAADLFGRPKYQAAVADLKAAVGAVD